MTTTTNGFALVTGASAGIGAIYADRLARRGHDLVLVARRADRLAALAERILRETGRTVEVLVADLTVPADLRRVETVLREDARITVLVNNAGVAVSGAMVDTDADALEALIDLNVTAPTRLAHAVAPRFAARGSGTIINIASVVAVAPELLNGVYGASKAYVLALTQSLQHELGGRGVRVQAVLPGATATDFWDISGTPLAHLPTAIVMGAEAMVDAALAGLDAGEVVTIPALPDAADWDRFEAARLALGPNLSHAEPAARYRRPPAIAA